MYRVQHSLSLNIYHDKVELIFIEIWGYKNT